MVGGDLVRGGSSNVPALGESRARVLAVLEAASSPIGVGQVAERVGLHSNTARFHLDALVASGMALRSMEERGAPGRPRALYTSSPGSARAGRRNYGLLAEILTSYVAGRVDEPAKAAAEAGEAWGRYLAGPRAPFQTVSAEAATRRMTEVLDDIGFVPEVVSTEHGRQVLLHHCPFRELAEDHQAVICSVHLGLMRGLLNELDAPLEAARLDPFVEPSLCVAHVVPRTDSRTNSGSRAGRP